MSIALEDNDILDFLRDVHGDVQTLRDEMLSDAVQTIEKKAYRAYGAMQHLERHGSGAPEPATLPSTPIPVPVPVRGPYGAVEAEAVTEITEVSEVMEITDITEIDVLPDTHVHRIVLQPQGNAPRVVSGRGADFFAPLDTKTRSLRRPTGGTK